MLNSVGDASDGSCGPVPLIAAVREGATVEKQKDDRAPDIVWLLVTLGADVHAQEPFYHRSALHVSALKGRCDCMRALLELGANTMALDKGGASPLRLAAFSHHAGA